MEIRAEKTSVSPFFTMPWRFPRGKPVHLISPSTMLDRMDYGSDEWFDLEIAQYRATLSRIVRTLCIKTGLDVGGAEMLPECIWRAVLRVLYPAESATRRLLAVAARNIAVKLHVRRARRRPFAGIAPARAAARDAADTETDCRSRPDHGIGGRRARRAGVGRGLPDREGQKPKADDQYRLPGQTSAGRKDALGAEAGKTNSAVAQSGLRAVRSADRLCGDLRAAAAPRRKAVPRITFFGSDAPLPVDPPKPSPPVDGLGRTLINAAHVCRRVRAH